MSLADFEVLIRMTGNFPRRLITIAGLVLFFGAALAAEEPAALSVASPDGRMTVGFHVDAAGAPRYAVQLDGKPVLMESRLGLVREDADFSQSLALRSASQVERVEDDYTLLTSKRRVNHYRANRGYSACRRRPG